MLSPAEAPAELVACVLCTLTIWLGAVIGKVTVLLPSEPPVTNPHCFYLATSIYLKPVARELSFTPSSLTEKELRAVDCMAIPTIA